MYNFKMKLVCLTSAAALAVSGINVPNMQVTSYAEEAQKPIVSQKAKGWTFGLYLCGQNLEEYDNAASSDLIEILKADVNEGFSKDNNIIVETGGCFAWHFKEVYSKYLMEEKGLSEAEVEQVIPAEIDSTKLSQYKINFEHEYNADDGKVKTVPTLEFIKDVAEYKDLDLEDEEVEDDGIEPTEVDEDTVKYADMGDEYFLSAFLEDLDKEFPAEHMALDLWNHGGGITGGVCYDEYTDDPITLGELKNILKNRAEAGYDKLDILGYDACLMASYESWVNLSAYAKVGVGSLTSEPGDGWYYTPFIEDLAKNYDKEEYTASEFGSSIVDAYKDFYKKDGIGYEKLLQEVIEEQEITSEEDIEELKKELDEYMATAMLSAVDLDKLALTSVKFSNLGEDLFKAYADSEGIKTIFEKSSEDGFIDPGTEIVDLTVFLNKIKEVAPERIEALKDSKNPYDIIASASYQNLIDNVEDVKKSVNDSLINAYNGWETNAFYDSLAMSIFVPDQMADNNIAIFNAEEYPAYSIGNAYAKLVYLYASNMEYTDFESLEYNPVFSYDNATGEFSLKLDEENGALVDEISAQKYIKKDGKLYFAGSECVIPWMDEETELKVKSNSEYMSVNGSEPIAVSAFKIEVTIDDKTYEDEFFYCNGHVNGKYGEFYFTKDINSGKYMFSSFINWGEDSEYEVDSKKRRAKAMEIIKNKMKDDEDITGDEEEYYDDEIFVVNELKPGDSVNFSTTEVTEAKYVPNYEYKEGEAIKSFTKDYVIKESDKKDFSVIGYDDDDNVMVVNTSAYTPEIEYVKAAEDDCYMAIGYFVLSDYYFDEEIDDIVSTYVTESKVFNLGKVKAFAEGKVVVEKEEFELTGEAITPKVSFENGTLVEGKDYEVRYEDNIGLGKAKVILKGLGDLEIVGERVVEFNIVKSKVVTNDGKEKVVYVTVVVKQPKQVKLKSVKNNKKKAVTVKWKKVKGATGYQVKYARNKKFTKGKKVKTIKDAKKASLTIKKLKKNKTYFVKVRAYTIGKDGKKVYGDWSNVKKIKIKK